MRRRAWSVRQYVGVLAVVGPALLGCCGASAAPAAVRPPAHRAAPVALSIVPRTPHAVAAAPATTFVAGSAINVRVTNLPRVANTFCVGLASLIDTGGLPINLGRLHATGARSGDLLTRIPAGLIGPEPPGPYLIFVGDCTTPAPMGDYGSRRITIPR